MSPEHQDDIWLDLIEYLLKFKIYDLAQKIIPNLNDKNTNRVKYALAQIEFLQGNQERAIEILNDMIRANPKTIEYHLLKAEYSFLSGNDYEAEETYLTAFKVKGGVKSFSVYLRLGYVFLRRKAWQDARSVLAKACELKPNSSISWLGLGISCLRIGEYKEGEQALTQANVYDPLNAEVWGFLALLALNDGGRMVQAHQALREMMKCELKKTELLEELADKLTVIGKYDVAETLYKKMLDCWQNNGLEIVSVGNVYSKLGKICHSQERLQEAKVFYDDAMKYLEGELEKERVEGILIEIRHTLETTVN